MTFTDLCLADLLKVLVVVQPGDGARPEHPVLLPHLVVLVALGLLRRQALHLERKQKIDVLWDYICTELAKLNDNERLQAS